MWSGESSSIDDEKGHLILAWVNLGSLVEGTLKLFLSVYYKEYQKGIVTMKKKSKDPDILTLETLRNYYNKKVPSFKSSWNDFVLKIQQRRNAIHAYQDRTIGSFTEFISALRTYLEFLEWINDRLPYPDELYKPRKV